MPYKIVKTSKCPASTPWGLIRADGSIKSCHETAAKAGGAAAIIKRHESGGSDKPYRHGLAPRD